MFEQLGRRTEMFTHIIYDNDVSPLDLYVSDYKLSSSRRLSSDINSNLHDYIAEMSTHYDSKHLLMMVGNGLNFEKAELYLSQIKHLADHFNMLHDDVKIVFSTLQFYDRAMSVHRNDLPVSYDDMISYTDDGTYYNTGLYTSRSNLKSYIRRASQVMHASSKLYHARLM